MTAHTLWLLRSQNRSRIAVGMRHGHLSVFQRAKSNQMPPSGTGNNQTGPSTLSENIIMMPTKLLSIQPIFRGLNFGDSNLILHTIRHNPERDKKLSMAHTERPRTLVLLGFDTLHIRSALNSIPKSSPPIAISPDSMGYTKRSPEQS
jgi:hypothetical protein